MNKTNIVPPIYRYKIHDKLYDLTDFVKVHPGGIDMFNNLKTDTNITPMIYTYHKTPKWCFAMLPKYEIPYTNASNDLIKIEYDKNYAYDGYCELKKLVYDEIYEKKIPLYWGNKEIAYNALMLSMYLGIWAYCFWNANNLSYWWMVLLAVMNTGICNLIFHETSHYTGFKNQNINNYLTFCMYPLMVVSYWKNNHNYLHHCFTNSESDENYNFKKYNTIIRHSINQQHKWFHKSQILVSLLMYSITLVNNGIYKSIKLKTLNCACFPILIIAFGFYKTMIWYLLCGSLFINIAQLSHIQHECINNEKTNDFLFNQVSSTMNYRTENPIIRFLTFGLDIQIEHHLFPSIPHSSLRQIQHVVRQYCDKNNIPYIEKPSIFPTIYSYITYLYAMGNP